MLRRGGVPDAQRAAAWFVRWWREDGAVAYARAALPSAREGGGGRAGWGFDLEWEIPHVMAEEHENDLEMADSVDEKSQSRERGDVNHEGDNQSDITSMTIESADAGEGNIRRSSSPRERLEGASSYDVQRKMEECIDAYVRNAENEEAGGGDVSLTQTKKRETEERKRKHRERSAARLKAKRGL
jgi:mitochondrial GTPase 1